MRRWRGSPGSRCSPHTRARRSAAAGAARRCSRRRPARRGRSSRRASGRTASRRSATGSATPRPGIIRMSTSAGRSTSKRRAATAIACRPRSSATPGCSPTAACRCASGVMALAFLVHFVGDLHQPLHAGDRGDLGGNRRRRLLRDHRRPDQPASRPGTAISPSAAISTPAGDAGRHPLRARRRRSGRRCAHGSVTDWARESWEASREFAYGTVLGRSLRPGADRAAGDRRGDDAAADPDRPPPGGARRAEAGAAARRGAG